MPFSPPLLDDFTGSNGSINGRSAGGGTWEAPGFSGHVAGEIASNVFQGQAGADRSGVIGGLDIGPDVQVAATISTLGSAIFLSARIQQDTFPVSSGDFYFVRVTIVGGASDDTLSLTRVIAGASSTLATFTGFDWNTGDAFGFELVENGGNTDYTLYRKPSGSGWGALGNGTDTNASRPTAAGHIGLEIDGTGAAVDNLQAGASLGAPTLLTVRSNQRW